MAYSNTIERENLDKANKAFEKQKLKNTQLARNIQWEIQNGGTLKNPVNKPLVLRNEEESDDSVEYRDPETLNNATIINSGQFRFNDQILDISPEKISIHVDEYQDSLLLMRQETPVSAQSGKKRIRMIVEFPVDIANGYTQLAKIITQIKKTPIATIENEKIRKELFGGIADAENIGVVVDGISGYVDDDYPTLIRCTMQLTWFNHLPYVDEIKYINQIGDRTVWQRSTDTFKFRKFYMEGTSNDNGVMHNDPTYMPNTESLVIMYKEYKQVSDSFSMESADDTSKVSHRFATTNPKTVAIVNEMKKAGWYLAEENEYKHQEVLDGVFYRWRKFEIPFTDIDSSSALILQNMSFSLRTNPTYIDMEQYSVPTIQFLGGSVSDVRAVVFAAAQYASETDKTPTGTSTKLSELMSIIKKVSDDRMRFSKYAKENHLLISHPISKLMKYKSHGDKALDFKYTDEFNNVSSFNIDNFLPVIVSSSDSETIPGLPFASRVQLDFRETRLAKASKPINYLGTSGSASQKDTQKIIREIIEKIYSNNMISFNREKEAFEMPRFSGGAPFVSSVGTAEEDAGKELVRSLNRLRILDKEVKSLETAYASKQFSKSNRDIDLENRDTSFRGNTFTSRSTISKEDIAERFSPDWIDRFIANLFMKFSQSIVNGEKWTQPYTDLFDQYTKVDTKDYRDLYPDMMLPKDEISPAYYFADSSAKVENFRSNILKNMPSNYKKYETDLKNQILNPDVLTGLDSPIKDQLQPPKRDNLAPAYNYAAGQKGKEIGVGRIHNLNDSNFRIAAIQQAIADATPPTYSLAQVYPGFQVQLFTDRFNFFQKFSAEDIDPKKLADQQQVDLLDMFDLNSILDIRIIKDEYEAADVMVIRIAASKKDLMAKDGYDPTYNPDDFSIGEVIDNIVSGNSTANLGISHNLEHMGLKEGVRVKAFLGNSVNESSEDLKIEFSGKIAAINGKDIVEIYCLGNGHELIQNTMGYNGDSEDRNYTLNSDTTDLIGELLSSSDEVKSFGNTKPEVFKNISANLPAFMGGVSALDNIYAPNMFPDFDWGTFGSDVVSSTIDTWGTLGSVSALAVGVASTAGIGLALGVVSLAGAAIYEGIQAIGRATNPCEFTVYQQTIWDVLQELTLRHPGYITATVPFDNRSTIYFGEPDGIYFFRGARSAAEKAIKRAVAKKSDKALKNPTMREIYDETSSLKKVADLPTARYPVLLPTAKDQFAARKADESNLELQTILNMQKCFRSYHLVTSQHDIISNDIEASSVGVANSVQVYHPDDNNEVNTDGTTWFSNYSLTDRMKADDDLDSDKINNKVFTFHNAHNEDPEIELPQRYAISVLCKELANAYKGSVTILGRAGIKPHDIVVLNDTHNRISGPVGVKRVMHIVSPRTGWRTKIYPKFLVFPQNSAGSFQMKAVLKATRYWLGVEAELFYSNMEKFMPTERADSNKFTEELFQAVDRFTGDKQTTDHGDSLTKEQIRREGEHAIVGNVGYSASSAAALLGANVAADQMFGLGKEARKINGSRMDAAGSFVKKAGAGFSGVSDAAKDVKEAGGALLKNRNAASVMGAGSSTLKFGIKGAATLGKGLLKAAPLAGGFLLESMIGNFVDGFISYMKYRQPISIFPLNKEGSPWMAGLNGYKENTAIEHIKEETVKAADKLGMTVKLASYLVNEWGGDVPIDRGVYGEYQVAEEPYDGDTIKIINGSTPETIRINGYDTGELKASESRPEDAPGPVEKEMGLKARDELRRLIREAGNKVEIERLGRPDKYGRTLANVKVNGLNVADVLQQKGLAMSYPKSYRKDYSKNLPPELKTDKEAIKQEREKAWKKLKEKHNRSR